MIDLFVKDTDEIIVTVFIGSKNKGKNVVAGRNKEEMIQYEEGLDVESLEEHTVVFKQPSFQDSVSIASKVTTADGTSLQFDPQAMRYAKMTRLLKSWSLKDAQGKSIPATEANLRKLNPAVAMIIGAGLDEQSGGV